MILKSVLSTALHRNLLYGVRRNSSLVAVRNTNTWKWISLLVIIPGVANFTWKIVDDKKHHKFEYDNQAPIRSSISRLWVQYLYENPAKAEEERETHLRQMQKRHKDYSEKKRLPENPIQPIKFFEEQKRAPVNKIDGLYNSS